MTTVSPTRSRPAGNGDHSGPGRIRPRSGALNWRTITGGFLVAAAAVIVFSAWLTATSGHGKSWVVADATLAAGTRLTSADLTTETMTLPAGTHGFRSEAALVGRTLAAPLAAGDLVQASALVAAGAQPAARPVTVAVPATDLDDLSVGDLVDVLVTVGTGAQATTSVVVRGARVISLAQPSGGLPGSSATDAVTLATASLAEVEAIVQASGTGTVSVVVGERSDGEGLGPGPATTGASASTAGPAA